jgi:hypothetical protein
MDLVLGIEKDITTLHNMVEVLNTEKGGQSNVEEIMSIKSDLNKVKAESQSCDKKISELKVYIILY